MLSLTERGGSPRSLLFERVSFARVDRASHVAAIVGQKAGGMNAVDREFLVAPCIRVASMMRFPAPESALTISPPQRVTERARRVDAENFH
jgi:hypothetical protein